MPTIKFDLTIGQKYKKEKRMDTHLKGYCQKKKIKIRNQITKSHSFSAQSFDIS